MDFNAEFYYEYATDINVIQDCFCNISCAKNSWREQSLLVQMTAPANYFCMAKIAEAIFNKIKVCGTFIIKFRIEILLLKDDSSYHENKWHSLGYTKHFIFGKQIADYYAKSMAISFFEKSCWFTLVKNHSTYVGLIYSFTCRINTSYYIENSKNVTRKCTNIWRN